MFIARLLDERGAIYDKSQNWGNYAFVSLPSPGDRLVAHYNDNMLHMTIICVHHRPVCITADGRQADEPAAEVVAKWTCSD